MIFNTQRFKEKLQKKGYAKSSIESYIRRVELYKDWCKQKNKTKIESDKKLAFLYLKFLKKQTSNYRTINRELQPLRLYYPLCI